MTTTIWTFIIFWVCIGTSLAQNRSKPDSSAIKLYGTNYHQPQFKGGRDTLRKFIEKNMHYPDNARENNIEGSTVVRFMVDNRGRVTSAKLVRGIGGGCDEESIRIVKSMPPWQPATYKNKSIASFVTLPVLFKLE